MTRSTTWRSISLQICCCRRWRLPQGWNICGELANRLTFCGAQYPRLVLYKAMILLLQLRLCGQFFLPGPLQRPGDKSMLRFNRVILASRSLDFIGGSFSPRLSEVIQLGALLLQTLRGSERQLQGGWLQCG
jgi:hypothetical protein